MHYLSEACHSVSSFFEYLIHVQYVSFSYIAQHLQDYFLQLPQPFIIQPPVLPMLPTIKVAISPFVGITIAPSSVLGSRSAISFHIWHVSFGVVGSCFSELLRMSRRIAIKVLRICSNSASLCSAFWERIYASSSLISGVCL